MPSDRVIEFYDLESFAIFGVSRKRKNMGWAIFDELSRLGKRVYAINGQEGVRDGVSLYSGLDSLPESPQGIIVCIDPSKTKGLLDQLINSKARYIWFQQGSYDSDVIKLAGELGIEPIKGCAMMYMPGAPGFHHFHRAINEFFGKGYK
jgi:predicted CoA-binding protein